MIIINPKTKSIHSKRHSMTPDKFFNCQKKFIHKYTLKNGDEIYYQKNFYTKTGIALEGFPLQLVYGSILYYCKSGGNDEQAYNNLLMTTRWIEIDEIRQQEYERVTNLEKASKVL